MKTLSFDEYKKRPEISASDLKLMARSMRHFKWQKENPREETDALALGSAIHCAILEPERFEKEYVCVPQCDRRTKEGKEIYNVFLATSEGKIVLSQDMFKQAVDISKSVLSSPKIRSMLSNGECEKSYFFELEGVKMKSRLDFVSDRIIVDVKSTKSANADSFAKDAYSLDYGMQMAIYQEAVFQATGKKLPVIILAVEKDSSYDYAVFHIDDSWLELGMKKARKLLRDYKEAIEKCEFEGYPKNVQELVLPAWAKVVE